ncbi:TIGR03619 family F420-dependent LLM class oxidoreductase [Mycobacterium xenopi]|uniref:LLM class F420-dependent oxidoreductase n=1 Tax=Mycobacterium xenopi TaxID=1789 RepID=A0AAD1GYH3_MYCXE|nr:TIGR03619 family F420-dependent LLM class oxidoreductase [Mycobacterium xenopi]MDA3640562.1 TIGR03619 family F420-dependent LLM class oxidoreductase [Mycobacterium xenopi]MDA3658010.1 TIGR03619 family F420-dependent LLM class oxidoreductase [Mycobacterium xenopi]MDA3662608.1 TIGR03619 family F420-dependent LLM class oxidoreductase [Mycobacterium xenopi]ORX15260.1 LLM class F420-dependent oxidoreductase [Mycobacterium xenopi]SPX78927.1 luciferase family protein [Mycobacterium xenopi]
MRFAVYLPNCMHVAAITQPWEHKLTGLEIVGVARRAEQLGYSMVFLPEHFLTPRRHLELSGNHYFDATTAQAFIAGATSTIRIGSMVTILPLHNPVIAAKSIATLDWFSGGRAQVTIGVGWLKEEYDIVGVPFTKRGRMTDEYLAAMFELWCSDSPSFDGEFVKFNDVAFGPKPIQEPRPVVWMGGDADAVLRRAARFGDGWAPWLTKPDELPAKIDYLHSQPGFDDRPFSVFYSLAVLSIGEEHAIVEDPNAQFGQSAQQVIDTCSRLAELGVTDTWVNPPPLDDFNAYLDHMQWVAEEVIPKVG